MSTPIPPALPLTADQFEARVAELGALKDGWDGILSKAVPYDWLRWTVAHIRACHTFHGLPYPYMFPAYDGSLSCEWAHLPGRPLLVLNFNDKFANWLWSPYDLDVVVPVRKYAEFEITDAADNDGYVAWLGVTLMVKLIETLAPPAPPAPAVGLTETDYPLE